jgi:hypothetical protein
LRDVTNGYDDSAMMFSIWGGRKFSRKELAVHILIEG